MSVASLSGRHASPRSWPPRGTGDTRRQSFYQSSGARTYPGIISSARRPFMNIKILLAIALVWGAFSLPNHKIIADDKKMIEGTWVIVEAELGGQKLPDEGIKGTRLILTADRYEYQNDRGEYKLYPAEEIKAMDIVGKEGPN